MEKFKLSVTNTEFYINRKKQRVRCKLTFYLKCGDNLTDCLLTVFDRTTNDPMEWEVIAEATPKNGDKFDVDTGMKIARAKAETMAYQRVSNYLGRFRDKLIEQCDKSEYFMEKANSVAEHNNEYIQQF